MVCFAGWITLFWLSAGLTVRAFLPLLILPLYVTVFYGRLSSRVLGNSFIALTGGMCYSIYLLHELLMSVSFRAVKHIRFSNDIVTAWVEMLLLMNLIVLFSTVFFLLVERPCMNPRWPRDLMARLRGTAPAKPATS